jgi:hypothetical protein
LRRYAPETHEADLLELNPGAVVFGATILGDQAGHGLRVGHRREDGLDRDGSVSAAGDFGDRGSLRSARIAGIRPVSAAGPPRTCARPCPSCRRSPYPARVRS